MEKKLIFFPEKEIVLTPAAVGLPFEDLYLDTADGVRINAWFVPFQGARTTLLALHGNAGNISHRVDLLQALHREVQVHVLMIDYREYGRSQGTVSEEGTYLDAQAAYDHLIRRSDTDPKRIVVFGQSLSAAVGVDLAGRRPLMGLILEAPFLSVKAMAKEAFPWLPIGGLLKTRYDSLARIGEINAPVLILHGDRDAIVPYAHGRRLFEAARLAKRFYTIRGAGHNDTYLAGGKGYFDAMAGFIADIAADQDRGER